MGDTVSCDAPACSIAGNPGRGYDRRRDREREREEQEWQEKRKREKERKKKRQVKGPLTKKDEVTIRDMCVNVQREKKYCFSEHV